VHVFANSFSLQTFCGVRFRLAFHILMELFNLAILASASYPEYVLIDALAGELAKSQCSVEPHIVGFVMYDAQLDSDKWASVWASLLQSSRDLEDLALNVSVKLAQRENAEPAQAVVAEAVVPSGASVPMPATAAAQAAAKTDFRTVSSLQDSIADNTLILSASSHAEVLGLGRHALGAPFVEELRCAVARVMWKEYRGSPRQAAALKFTMLDLAAKKENVVVSEITGDFQLMFAGAVSVVRSSFKLCSVFGVDMFLHGSGYCSLNSDMFVPAWVSKTSDATSKCFFDVSSIAIKFLMSSDLSTHDVGTDMKGEKTIEITMTIPTLVGNTQAIGKKAAPLVRSLTDEERRQKNAKANGANEEDGHEQKFGLPAALLVRSQLQATSAAVALPKEKFCANTKHLLR
jgi:hypothetical protein